VITFIVQFYEFGGGSVFEVAAGLNGVSYDPTSPIATPLATGTGSIPSSTSVPLGAASNLTPTHGLASLALAIAGVVVGGVL